MHKNNKTTSTKSAGVPKTDAPPAFREMAEKGATQSKEAFDKLGAASTDVANNIKTCYSTAVRGAQEYNNKVIEFTQAMHAPVAALQRPAVKNRRSGPSSVS